MMINKKNQVKIAGMFFGGLITLSTARISYGMGEASRDSGGLSRFGQVVNKVRESLGSGKRNETEFSLLEVISRDIRTDKKKGEQLEDIKRLLEDGARIDEQDERGLTVAHKVVEMDRPDILQLFVAKHPGIINFVVSQHGPSLLHYAIMSRRAECVDLLLKQDGLLHQRYLNGDSPLFMAARTGNFEIFRSLLTLYLGDVEKFRELFSINNNGETVLHCAIQGKNEKIIQCLLKIIKSRQSQQAAAEFFAELIEVQTVSLGEQLSEWFARVVNKIKGKNYFIDMWADKITKRINGIVAEKREEFSLDTLMGLANIRDIMGGVNEKTIREGASPLHYAACCNPSSIPCLLAVGADPNLSDGKGKTPLDYSVEKEDETAVQSLLRYSEKLPANFLFYVVNKEDIQSLLWLLTDLENGGQNIDIDQLDNMLRATDATGKTSLERALDSQNINLIERLSELARKLNFNVDDVTPSRRVCPVNTQGMSLPGGSINIETYFAPIGAEKFFMRNDPRRFLTHEIYDQASISHMPFGEEYIKKCVELLVLSKRKMLENCQEALELKKRVDFDEKIGRGFFAAFGALFGTALGGPFGGAALGTTFYGIPDKDPAYQELIDGPLTDHIHRYEEKYVPIKKYLPSQICGELQYRFLDPRTICKPTLVMFFDDILKMLKKATSNPTLRLLRLSDQDELNKKLVDRYIQCPSSDPDLVLQRWENQLPMLVRSQNSRRQLRQ